MSIWVSDSLCRNITVVLMTVQLYIDDEIVIQKPFQIKRHYYYKPPILIGSNSTEEWSPPMLAWCSGEHTIID